MPVVVPTKNKRVVHVGDEAIDFGEWWLSDFVQKDCFANQEVIARAVDRVKDISMSDPSLFMRLLVSEGLDNIFVHEIWNVVNVEVKYRYDEPTFGVIDFWQLPNETWTRKTGDCEDTTFLTSSAIWHFLDFVGSPGIVYACIGFYVDTSKQYYGHGFVLYRHPHLFNGTVMWVETTLETALAPGTWLIWGKEKLVPVYMIKLQAHKPPVTLRIDRDYKELGLTEDYVRRHWEYIRMMMDYVEAGIRTPVKWMHKTKRPANTADHVVTH